MRDKKNKEKKTVNQKKGKKETHTQKDWHINREITEWES